MTKQAKKHQLKLYFQLSIPFDLDKAKAFWKLRATRGRKVRKARGNLARTSKSNMKIVKQLTTESHHRIEADRMTFRKGLFEIGKMRRAVPEHRTGVKHQHLIVIIDWIYIENLSWIISGYDHVTNFRLDTTELLLEQDSSINWTDSLKFVNSCRYLRSLRARFPNIPVSLSERDYTSCISSCCQSRQRLDWVIEKCSITW